MFSKQDLLDTIEQEVNICKHLYSKLPDGKLDYRPSDNQRSTLELLQYLTICIKVPAKGLINNDWTFRGDEVAKSKEVTADQFCSAMDQQLEEVKGLVNALSDDDLKKTTSTPMRTETTIGKGLVTLCLRFITAYKLQLFLHAKAVGGENLTTANSWMGMDMPSS